MKAEIMRSDGLKIRYLFLSATLAVFFLVVSGYLVRFSEAGLACPDWPTCYGQWGMPENLLAQLQYGHRVLSGVSALLVSLSAFLAFTRLPGQSWIKAVLAGAVGLLVVESGLGAGYVFLKGTPAGLETLHLFLALATLALVLTATVLEFYRHLAPSGQIRLNFQSPFARLALVTLAASFLVMVSGVFVSASGAASTCPGWPFCAGSLVPASPLGWVELGHRLLSGIASVTMVILLVSAWRTQRLQRVVLPAATLAAGLFAGQIFIGALKVSRGFPLDLIGLHAISSAALWVALVVLVVAAGTAPHSSTVELNLSAQNGNYRQRLRDFLILTKPIIVVLLLVTTYAGMVVGGRSLPGLALTFWTMLGGALAAGGSSAINQYIDRDLDRNMQRTAKRPLASRRMTPAEGLAFGLGLLVLSFYILAGMVNLLAALLSLFGMIYYVLIYSIFLKKATVQNIVIGGGAGAVPPVVGWAAATGSLAIPAFFLFAIVFLWTPPHFWALALVRKNDYARAGVPMLPVVRGEQVTRTQIFIYTLELVGLTLLMPVLKMTGSLFLISALVLGSALILTAWRVLRQGGNKNAWKMYRYSSMYLAFIFAALVVDVLV